MVAAKHSRVVPHVVTGSLQEARELATAFSVKNKFPLRANAVLTGYPRIRPMDPIIVNGVPNPELCGVWIVLRVIHQFNVDGASPYQLEVELGTNPKLLNWQVSHQDTLLDDAPGLEEEIDLSEEEFYTGIDEQVVLLDELPEVFTLNDENVTLTSTEGSSVFSQSSEPPTPAVGDIWWKSDTSELFVGFASDWTQVGTSFSVVPGTATGAYQVELDLAANTVFVDELSTLRVAELSDLPPVAGAGTADLVYAAGTWYSQAAGVWTVVSSPAVHLGVAASLLRGLQNVAALGWIVTPRGLEPSDAVLNEDPYSETAPDFASAEETAYWLAGDQ